jgi:hypothetical protein
MFTKVLASMTLGIAALAGVRGADQGWFPHEGGLLKYRVNIRFGEEPDTLPAGWKFGRVSAVATDSRGEVYVFHRGPKADPIIIFDSKGKYLRSWGRGTFGNPHGRRVDLGTGKILGSMESPGHWINVSRAGEIFVGSLTGNVFRWYQGWLTTGVGSEEGLRPANVQ